MMNTDRSTVVLRMMLNTALLVVFGYAAYEAQGFAPITARLPTGVSIGGFIVAAVSLHLDLKRLKALRLLEEAEEPPPVPAGSGSVATAEQVASRQQRNREQESDADAEVPGESPEDEIRGLVGLADARRWIFWILLLVFLMALFGMLGAVIAFLPLVLRAEGEMKPSSIIAGILGIGAVLLIANDIAGLEFPDGWLLPALLGMDGLLSGVFS